MMHWFYYGGRVISWTALTLFARWQVTGRENVPKKGPLLIVANHLNLSDPSIVAMSVGRRMVFMAKDELFRKPFPRYFIRGFGAFPVRRGALNREAFKEAENWLNKDVALVMFPEGGRSRDTKLMTPFPGSVMIATKLNVPILPVGIAGSESVGGRFWWLKRPRITVKIGKPFSLPPVYGKLEKEERARLADYIMEHIAALLPRKYRGEYGKHRN
ncbi:MAG: lysophospholipid acyltransferase family protein [Dehalococcoidales bacterium]|nr:lysophospholipid acyltransferase family protein [Dehalococcoidales bacterium]